MIPMKALVGFADKSLATTDDPHGARGAASVFAAPSEAVARKLEEAGLAERLPEEGLNGNTVAELKAIAGAEGIDLGDVTKKADIIAAIELARDAKSA